MPRTGVWLALALVPALGAGVVAGRLITGQPSDPPQPLYQPEPPPPGEFWPIFVNLPEGPPRVDTGRTDDLGRPITVSCASCHAALTPNPARKSPDEPPMQFHQGLTFDHGGLSCLSCHNPNNYNTLRLADGAAVPYPDVMTMCAQCHAPQARDWEHGAHGGMTGYWDRTRGERIRKSCIDCHDPHAPAFPAMTPTFKPIDRFLGPAHGDGPPGGDGDNDGDGHE
jgi:hypothetical protein